MNWVSVVMIVMQIITTIVIGVIGYFLKDKFSSLKEADIENANKIEKIEDSFFNFKETFSDFKEKMPLMYTTREDQLRAQGAIEARIEKLGSNMDLAFEKINTKIELKLDNFSRGFDEKVTQIGEQLNKHLQRED